MTNASCARRFDSHHDYALPLYRVSFLWYSFLSVVITVGVGTFVSAVVALLERHFGLTLASDSDGQSTPETVQQDSKSFWVVSKSEEAALNKSDLPNKLLVRDGLKDTRALHLSIKGRTGTNGSRHI